MDANYETRVYTEETDKKILTLKSLKEYYPFLFYGKYTNEWHKIFKLNDTSVKNIQERKEWLDKVYILKKLKKL